jgi:branched-chain amino acid transport system ATP-binding protein
MRKWSKSFSETSVRAEHKQPLLELAGVTAGYRRLQVLWGVDLAIHDGESVVLLGANGAGKTTLLKAIMRLVDVWAGHIHFAGEDITDLRTDQRVRRGIVFMSESPGFLGLTVEENVLIGAQFLPHRRTRTQMEEVYAVFPALADRRRAPAGSLSGGQRKMLGIAKALVGDPRLLVMDEPSAGLSPLYVKEVIAALEQFRTKQLTLLVAEQNVKFLTLADRVYTLDNGRIGFSGTVAAMHENDALRRAYFGLKA